MSDPVERQQLRRLECPDNCPWREAYLLLRAILVNPVNAATPAKHLGGAMTVAETVLSKALGIEYGALQKIIRDDFVRVHGEKAAEDRAMLGHPHL